MEPTINQQPIINISGLKNYLGNQWVHEDINMTIYPNEIIAIIGGSGSGKTTILRCLLMLLQPTSGHISLFGENISALSLQSAQVLRSRWGVLFQHSALFSGLTVLENVMFPMQEFTQLDNDFIRNLAMLKIALVGLPKEACMKYPSELSGGMQRRAAAARAIAMDPELLFLDEPTTGLDPHSARLFDDLLLFLRKALNLTIVMITHDIATLKNITDRVAFIGEGRVLCFAPIRELMKNKHPLIVDYFSTIEEP